MLKNVPTIVNALKKWYVKEIAPLDWKLTLAAPFVGIMIDDYLKENEDYVKRITDVDGLIDVDYLYEEYKTLLNTSGKSYIEIAKVKLTIDDLNKLYEFIKRE